MLADIGYNSHPRDVTEVCENLAVERNSPNAMAYYTLAMLLMMLFYGADFLKLPVSSVKLLIDSA